MALALSGVHGGVIGDYGGDGGQQSAEHGGYDDGQSQNLESGGDYGGSDHGSYEGGNDLSNHIGGGGEHGSGGLSQEGLSSLQQGFGHEQGGGQYLMKII